MKPLFNRANQAKLLEQRYMIMLIVVFMLMLVFFNAVTSRVAPSKMLSSVTFAPTDKVYQVGNDLLGQYSGAFSADTRHIALRYDSKTQQWLMQNTSPTGKKLLFIAPNKREFIAKQWQLQNGDDIILGQHRLNVQLTDDGINLADSLDGATFAWDNYALTASTGANFADCPRNEWWRGQVKRHITTMTHRALHIKDNAFSLGGQVQCHNRLKLSGVEVNSAAIFRDDLGDYYLRPTHGQVVQLMRQQQLLPIPAVVVDPANRLIVGKTRYRLFIGDDKSLTMRPTINKHFFPKFVEDGSENPKEFIPFDPQDKGIKPTWIDNNYWQKGITDLPVPSLKQLGLLAFLTLVLLYPITMTKGACQRVGDTPPSQALSLILFFLWFATWWYIPMENLTTKAYVFVLMWLLVTLRLYHYYRQQLSKILPFWLVLTGLMTFGLVAQLQLAGGAFSSKWFVYPNNHFKFFATLLLVISLILPLPSSSLFDLASRFYNQNTARISFFHRLGHLVFFFIVLVLFMMISVILPYGELIVLGIGGLIVLIFWFKRIDFGPPLIACFIVAIFTQGIMGSEEGVAGLQPIELAKTLMVWLGSAVLIRHYYVKINDPEIFRGWKNILKRGIWYVLGSASMIFAVAVAGIAFGVHDYSPLVIAVFLVASLIWVWLTPIDFNVRRLTKAVRLLYLIAIPALIYGVYYLHERPDIVMGIDWIPQGERFLIWLDPWSYPDSGRQLQLALSAVHGEGQNWFGINAFGANTGIQALPAVQDDFMLAFFLHKFGGIMGLILLITQILWLYLLVTYYFRGRDLARNSNYDKQRIVLFIAYSLFGFASMQFVHWVISWGNTLGLLPIMGQPMTFLSAGNSHLFALALPTSVFLLVMMKLDMEQRATN